MGPPALNRRPSDAGTTGAAPTRPAAIERELAHPLLAWWEAQRRELPWRETRDPWAVLVCEVMAQQTQVSRVAERWAPFLEQFPDPAAVAEAPVGALLQVWSGLGYNRRALNLHRCAVAVVERHAGRLPATLPELLALPGIGPYTARAVLAFAFEVDAAIVDTNAARVLARWEGHRLTAAAAQGAADAALVAGQAWAWNQAMLDLGAGICTRRTPRCNDCPVRDRCAWAEAGHPDPDPADGSAGVSVGQARFAGSDRQGRGRLIETLRSRSVAPTELAEVMGWPSDDERAARVAAALVGEGLAHFDGTAFRLP